MEVRVRNQALVPVALVPVASGPNKVWPIKQNNCHKPLPPPRGTYLPAASHGYVGGMKIGGDMFVELAYEMCTRTFPV